MKLHQKIPAAISAINFISRHDDAPAIDVSKALDALQSHIDAERSEMTKRRAAKEKTEKKLAQQ